MPLKCWRLVLEFNPATIHFVKTETNTMIRHALTIGLILCCPFALPTNAPAADLIDQASGVLDADGKTVWYRGELLGIGGKGWTDTESPFDRLPQKAKEMVRPPVWELSHDTAGMQIRFATDAPTLQVRWTLTKNQLGMPHMPATGVSGVDLYARDESGKLRFCANGRPTGIVNQASFSLPTSDEYVLYLPLYNGIKLIELGIPVGKHLSRLPTPPPSDEIVFYGTSITQGGCVSRPGLAAPALVSRALDRPIINLGFSGNGQMEPELAQLLAELDPAIYVLDTLWNMSPEMVSERVEPFVNKLRQTRPTTPIVLVEDSSVGNLPSQKGAILRKIFAKLTEQGDKHLYFLPNTGMLGDDWEGTVDGCHPNDLGMARQAAVFATFLQPILKNLEAGNDK